MHPLAILRLKHGLTQADLARRAKMSPSTIANIEIRRVVPRYRTRKRILDTLGISFFENQKEIFNA